MCGIAGILRPNATDRSLDQALSSMATSILSRGPDGSGRVVADGVALLNTRLAIIDLATGDQPIWNEDRTVACVFNGEIYNFRELRKQLLRTGHRMSTTGDTEVLVHLYEEYDADLVHHLHGMYAFAICDWRQRRLVLGRDRLGIKPLFLGRLPDGVAFSSSIRSLIGIGVSADPDTTALAQYLRYHKIPEPRTAYSEITTLLPGHVLLADIDTSFTETHRFYSLPSTDVSPSCDLVEAEDLARTALRKAVSSHLIADVEVAAFLSGGVDSSLVVAEAQKIANRPLRTFSAAFPGDARRDETAHALRVAAEVGTKHEVIEMRPAPLELLWTAIEAAGQPFGVASFLPLLLLSQKAAEDVKVVLTGDGGDEVGFGYPWYRWARWARGSTRPGATRAMMATAAHRLERSLPHLEPLRRGLKFLGGAVLGGPAGYDRWRYDANAREAVDLLLPEFQPRARPPSPMAEVWLGEGSNALRHGDLQVLLRDEMLPKVDRAGMAYGLEMRVPLLDDEFVEAMFAIPTATHLDHSKGKAVLRRWVVDAVPGANFDRPKHGFDVPIADWLRTSLCEEVRRLLLSPAKSGVVNPAAATQVWRRMGHGVPGAAHTLYAMLVLELAFQ